MMDSYWNLPSRPRYSSTLRGIPVHQQTKPSQPAPPKVVSIPVHFVGSDRSRSDSAVKIQKVFRGFLVRKSVKKIAAMSREVDEIEKMISKEESVELIRRDSKERLKVNETLMSLLFRLDSVRGVDSGVRDYRKKVIKKAIALQEMVDAIVVADQPHDNAEIVAENQGSVDDTFIEEKQVIVEHDNATPFLSECGGESVGTRQSESLIEGCEENNNNNNNNNNNRSGNDKRNKELLERMVEENERMMGLMEELVERNQMQTCLLSSLSQRVEQLERAFICDKLRRKKKRHAAAGTGDGDGDGDRDSF